MIKYPNSEKIYIYTTFVQKHKFSEVQLFLQQIIKGAIKGVLFDYTSYYFNTYGTHLYFYGFTAYTCLIPVIKCECHFQLGFKWHLLDGTWFPLSIII